MGGLCRLKAEWTVALPTSSQVGYGGALMDYELVSYEVVDGSPR